jgi:hypothetical protein
MSKSRPTNQAMEIVPLLDTSTSINITVDGMIEPSHRNPHRSSGEDTPAYSILNKYNLLRKEFRKDSFDDLFNSFDRSSNSNKPAIFLAKQVPILLMILLGCFWRV